MPPEGQAVIELTVAVVLAEGLLTAWTRTKSVVSMVMELPSMADVLETGAAVAQVLQGGDGMPRRSRRPLLCLRDQALLFRTAELRRAFAEVANETEELVLRVIEWAELKRLSRHISAA